MFTPCNAFVDGHPAGAGLGMSICKEIASAHGGSIEIENATPGTIFRVHKPTTGI